MLMYVYACIVENVLNSYTTAGNRIGQDEPGDRSKGEIVADITTTFTILLAIFFPSCTGTPPSPPPSHQTRHSSPPEISSPLFVYVFLFPSYRLSLNMLSRT